MEHLLINTHQIHNKEIFSDSHCSRHPHFELGLIIIITRMSSRKLHIIMSALKSRGWKIEIVWTPRHIEEVVGNDVVDRLAKVAADEAKELGKVWLLFKTSNGRQELV